MSLIVTQAIVLHAFDYLETSRVLRLVTRDAGMVSVIAKGARRTRARSGSGVDLFAQGEVELYVKASRDLQTLASFDVARSHTALALDVERFAAASAIAELVLRMTSADSGTELFDAVADALASIAGASAGRATAAGLGAAWSVVSAAGFAPAIDDCASCHAAVPAADAAVFSHPAGGVLCARCARLAASSRQLPPAARDVLRAWLERRAEAGNALDAASLRAHQRLLREFVREHITDERPLRAFAAWETGFGAPAAEPAR